MELKMDIAALAAFLDTQFPQIADEVAVTALSVQGLTLALAVKPHHLRPGGTVSGPSMFMLADVAVYLNILAHLGPVALAVTTSSAMDFMRKPAAGVDLFCQTRILKMGRSLAVGDALIYSAGQAAPVARANMTYAIPPNMGYPDT